MNIYCSKCGCIHSFLPTQIEVIIYSFQARVDDLVNMDSLDIDETESRACLKTVLDNGMDEETYLEFVDEMVELRTDLQRDVFVTDSTKIEP